MHSQDVHLPGYAFISLAVADSAGTNRCPPRHHAPRRERMKTYLIMRRRKACIHRIPVGAARP